MLYNRGKYVMTIIKTKDIIALFLITKILSVGIAFYIFGLDGNDNYIEMLAHGLSLVLLFGSLFLIAKRSGTALLSDSKVAGPKWGNLIVWMILCIPLGILVRFGCEGIYLTFVNTYDHQLALAEFNDLLAHYSSGNAYVVWILISVALIGSLDEEFAYRRILLWHFSEKYGVVVAILVTSLVFGAIHWNPVALLAAGCLACAYLASGRLWVAVIAHASGNLFHPLGHPLIAMMTWKTYFIASIVGSVVLCLLLGRFAAEIKRRAPMYSRRNLPRQP